MGGFGIVKVLPTMLAMLSEYGCSLSERHRVPSHHFGIDFILGQPAVRLDLWELTLDELPASDFRNSDTENSSNHYQAKDDLDTNYDVPMPPTDINGGKHRVVGKAQTFEPAASCWTLSRSHLCKPLHFSMVTLSTTHPRTQRGSSF